MSKQVNYPYQTTTLSAKGSAEVIARGFTNDYINTWSYDKGISNNFLESWDRVATFPTVVRTGNFVWCWYREYSNAGIYVLIDVVPDPQEEYQLGNNIAYPALLNGSVGEMQYPVLPAYVKTEGDDGRDPMINTLITDGPYYPLTVGDKNVHIDSAAAGFKAGFWHDNRSYKEIVADKWGRTPDVWGGFATSNGANIPWMIGWGSRMWPLTSANGKSSTYIYGLFAPFATYEQFQTLYGAEKDWIYRTYEESNSPYKTLFGPTHDTSNGAGVQYTNTADIENDYPFTVEAMQPQTKYRDVAGDTTGDGIDNTPSFEAALAGYAVASITKCDGFPEDLIPGLDMEAINKKLNDAKAGIESAISSTGLLDLEKKLEGFKADIEDKFPKATNILNFIEAIADLDLNNLTKDAIDKLKEEWKFIDEVDKFVDGIIDDITNFDICSLVDIKGKTADDGSLVKKPASPSIPDKVIEKPKQSSYVSEQSSKTAQTTATADVGITPKDLEAANKEYNDFWNLLNEDKQFSWGREIQSGSLPEGPKLKVWVDGIMVDAVLDEDGKLVPAPDAFSGPNYLLPGEKPAVGGGSNSVDTLQNDSVRVPLQQSMIQIHGSGPGSVYHRNKYKNLYEDGNGGGQYTGQYKNPLSPTPENDVSIYDLIKPPAVPGITDIDPETQQRIDDYLNPGGKNVEKQPVYKSGAEWEKRLREIQATKAYQTYAEALNNKVDPTIQYNLPGDDGLLRGGMSLESITKLKEDLAEVTIPIIIYRNYKDRLNFFKKKLKDSMLVDGKRGDYFPATGYDITAKWDIPEHIPTAPGTEVGITGVLDNNEPTAVWTQKAEDTVAGMDAEFVTAIKKYFFTDEGVRLQQTIMAGQDPPFDEIIQKKLQDAIAPDDNEGDPVNDTVAPIEEYDPSSKGVQGTMLPQIEDVDVSLSSSSTYQASGNRVTNISKIQGARRFGAVQPRLLSILEKSAEEANYTIEIFSGGQVAKSQGGINGVNRYGDTKRHDNGYAVDIYTYNKDGRKLRVKADPNHRDTLAIKDFVKILLKNGITSVGADSDYMNGDLHLDIANSAGVAPKACWGQGPPGVERRWSRIYAPSWLTSTFDSNVT